MGRLDLFRSLLRHAARSGGARLGASDLAIRIERTLSEVVRGRFTIGDAELTAAVARVPSVAAATVTSAAGVLRIDAAFDDGRSLGLRFTPHAVKFAPAGAKEVAFLVDPPEAAEDPRGRAVFGAIAGAVARALWKAALRPGAPAGPSAFVTRDGAALLLDLRTVPEVQFALRTRLGALVIDVLALRSIEVRPGGLTLHIALPGLSQS